MKKSSGVHRFLILILVLLLTTGQLNLASFNVFAEENGNDDLSYEVEKELTTDKTKANLKLKVTPKNEQLKILTIETPDGKVTEGQEAAYTADKNGTVNFKINYQNTEDSEETKTFIASYEVSEIVSKAETSKEPEPTELKKPTELKTTTNKENLKSEQTNVTLSIPEYNQTAWANGDIKTVTATVEFADNATSGKKVNFTLPDGMRFVSLPVPNNYKPTNGTDSSIMNYLGTGDPLGNAITSITVPKRETNYNQATFGTVSYELDSGTEKASFNFSVRVDAAKYYGATDLQSPIKTEVFANGEATPLASAEQGIHAEGKKVVGYAGQDHVKTMFRNWYINYSLPEVLASSDTADSYNYTKPYSVVNGLNQPDERGVSAYLAKNLTITLYYPEGMEYVGIIGNGGESITSNSDINITPYPSEHKVVIDYKEMNINGAYNSIFSVKYKIPKETPAGTYSAAKVPHAVITTYDDEVFEADALTSNAGDLTTKAALDTCKVVDTSVNKMRLTPRNYYINPDNETWAGSIQIDNQKTAGMKTNQVYQIEFDPNWEAYSVNLPFDSKVSGNKITNVQYKTNLNSNYRSYSGDLPAHVYGMVRLEANNAGLQEGEYFTEVKANVGDFSPGFVNVSPSGTWGPNYTASYGVVKPGITSVQFKASVWDAADEANTKSSGTSTYSVSNTVTDSANGRATFYNKKGAKIKVASAGETITTNASLVLFDYPYGTRTVINNPEVYLRELDGTTINPSTIKLTDQAGKEVDFTVKQETANNGEKVYVLKTTGVTVGAYVDYPYKAQYLNVSYDTTFDVTLDTGINMDIQNVLAWGGSDVSSAIGSNSFSDAGLDVNKNGKDNEILLSANSSTLNVPKQDTVTVETFLNVAGEGTKAAYNEGDDSTVSYFTPGTDADYTVQITNTSNSEARTFELYIPIPKTGQNFGSKFQSEAFKWDMKLNGAIDISAEQQSQFEIGYATAATADNYESADIYSETVSDYENVNMVRIKVKNQINAGETQKFKVPLKVDETFDSANEDNKISTRDIYNPYYHVITNTFSGSLSGTKVGAELVIGEVSGTLFNDKDANGLFEKSKGDVALGNETIELHKWNNVTSAYEPVTKNGENITTKTDANGTYTFDYNSDVGYGNYAVKFPDKTGYQYTLKNVGKNTAIDSDVPYSGTDKGWAKNIDPTLPVSQTINAGYYAYTPEQDLKVNLNEKRVQTGRSLAITLPKVASTNGQAGEDTIEPNFFQNIQASTEGYKWTTADTDVTTVQTQNDGSAAVVGVSTNNQTIAATDLTIAIQDIFGTKQSSTAPVYVTAADGTIVQQDGFTMGATDFSLEYKDAVALTSTEALSLGKTAAFEEVKNGVNSSAQDRLSSVQVNQTQLTAIKNGSNQGGTYPLTYTLTKDGKTVEVRIQVTVAQDLTTVNAHDSTLYVGDTWTAADNFDSAIDKEGESVPFADVTVSGTVNTSLAGTYPVTYTYNGVSKTIQIIVKDNLTAVNAHDSTIYTGDTWNAADNFDSALDKDGNPVDFSDVTVTGSVNTNQAGSANVTYSYDGISTTIVVTVKENKSGISAHDSSIYVGDNWTATDNFDSAFDKDGNPVAFQDVKVTEKPTVNTNKAGVYQVTYSYGKATTTITLTVKEIQTDVNAHDSILYIGDSWNAADNFDSARDKDGNTVPFSAIQVTGTVDTNQPGTYPVTYSYDGVSTLINVTVKAPQTSVKAHDSVIYTGDSWNAKDNFDSAKDKDGKAVDFQKVTVDESPIVDPSKPGIYQVTYSYDGVSTTINITVDPRQTSIKVHDSTIYAGDDWSAKDNFDNATDKKGDSVSFADMKVTGQVDTYAPGTYEISYSYDGVKVIAHITVLENKAQITVQDRTIQKGDTWSAEDNFISAANRDGEAISFEKVQVSGTVNTNKASDYQVTYTIDPNEGTTDAGKKQLSVTATIQVEDPSNPSKPNQPSNGGTSLQVKSNTQQTATYEDAKPLPKTGDQSITWIVWAGMGLLILSVLLWVINRRRHIYK
ncbi:bacterial Ig-like domain-containing protein [Listeria seeligeri]|uniref:bacterial Ig-like domain-containing protein n=1 Tax=Listeria seeligeri TaxID=1640 RepID=UPI0030CAC8B5